MATLKSYIERMPVIYRHRYEQAYWVTWANALLERLAGQGTLPPQSVTRGVPVHHGVWIDRPPMCRDIKELRDAETQRTLYRFVEENNRFRLLDIVMPEAKRVAVTVKENLLNGFLLDNSDAKRVAGDMVGWLLVVEHGAAAGNSFIVSDSFVKTNDDGEELFGVVFLDAGEINPPIYNWTTPEQVQQSAGGEADEPFISDGYFVHPKEYLIASFIAKFVPVLKLTDDLGIGEYDNLVETWLRWKVEEQVSAISQECAYWYSRVEDELSRIRAERENRASRPQGRFLAGFMR